MRWRLLCSGGLGALAGAMLLASPAWAQVTLAENGPYDEDVHYTVWWYGDEPWITINQPSDPELGPYDFECYVKQGEEVMPANIAGISAGQFLQGDVELMVRSSDLQHRLEGAANVKRLDVERQNVHLTLKEFVIAVRLGTPLYPDTYVYAIDGPFWALASDSNLHVHYLTGDFTLVALYADIEVTEAVTHNANVEIQNFVMGQPHNLTIAGSLAGDLTLGDPGYYG